MADEPWAPATIEAPYGEGGEMTGAVEIVGWRSGRWFLDYRVDETPDGLVGGLWSLTHVPTGYHCCSVRGRLGFAKRIAAEVDAWGDWASAETPDDIRVAFSDKAKKTMSEHAGEVFFGRTPLWSQITNEANEDAK